MKNWKPALSLAVCFIMVLALMTGCNTNTPSTTATPPTATPPADTTTPAAETPAAETPAVTDEQVTLRFSWWGTDPRHEATLAVIDAFMKKYPNIKIEAEYGAQAGYNDNKTVEFSTKTAPDLFQIETGAGKEYYRMGVLYNLSNISTLSFDKFDPDFLAANGQFGTGSQWCIPTGAAGTSLVVNKTLADQIGIDLTKQMDYEDLIELGAKVQAYNPEMYLISANTTTGVAFFIRAYSRQLNGVAMIDDEAKKLVMTEEQFTQCFDLISRLYSTKTCAPASMKSTFDNNDMEDPNWISGKYVASAGYTSNIQALEEANNTDAQIIPGALPLLADRKSDGWTNNCPQFMGVSADTKYPEQCGLFYDFFFNSEEAAEILGTVRSIPPTAFAQKIVKDNGSANPIVVEATDKSLTYKGFDDSGFTTNENVTQILRDAYEALAYGTITPAAAAKDVVAKINDYLAAQ